MPEGKPKSALAPTRRPPSARRATAPERAQAFFSLPPGATHSLFGQDQKENGGRTHVVTAPCGNKIPRAVDNRPYGPAGGLTSGLSQEKDGRASAQPPRIFWQEKSLSSADFPNWWCPSAAHHGRRPPRWRRRTPASAWPSPAAPEWSAPRSCTWWTAPWQAWWPCRRRAFRRRARRSPRLPQRRAWPLRPDRTAASSGPGRCPRPSTPSYNCRRSAPCWWGTRRTGRSTGPACRSPPPWPGPG